MHGRAGISRKTKVIVACVVGALLIGGAATAVVLKLQHDDDVAAANRRQEDAAAAAKAAADAQAAREAEAARAQAAKDKVERDIRRLTIKDMERSITKDARKRVDEGVLDGPIYSTQCQPVGGGSSSDLTEKTTKFQCMAIDKKLGGGQVEGYNFDATMNWSDGSYTWQLSLGG